MTFNLLSAGKKPSALKTPQSANICQSCSTAVQTFVSGRHQQTENKGFVLVCAAALSLNPNITAPCTITCSHPCVCLCVCFAEGLTHCVPGAGAGESEGGAGNQEQPAAPEGEEADGDG